MPKPCFTSPAAVPSVCSTKSDLPSKPCFGTSAYKPSCRPAICVAAIRRMRAATGQSRANEHQQPRRLPPHGEHPQLPRHQNRRRQLRHLLRPARKIPLEEIFPGCRIIDIHEYLLEKGVKLNGVKGQQYLYHDPCHTPIKTMNATQMASNLMGQKVVLSDRCCGESGMFAVKRPDIATQVKFRKQEEIEKTSRAAARRTRQNAHLLPCLLTRPESLRRRQQHARRLYRHRNGETHPRRKLAGRVCEKSQ